jgi:hypothetical protein
MADSDSSRASSTVRSLKVLSTILAIFGGVTVLLYAAINMLLALVTAAFDGGGPYGALSLGAVALVCGVASLVSAGLLNSSPRRAGYMMLGASLATAATYVMMTYSGSAGGSVPLAQTENMLSWLALGPAPVLIAAAVCLTYLAPAHRRAGRDSFDVDSSADVSENGRSDGHSLTRVRPAAAAVGLVINLLGSVVVGFVLDIAVLVFANYSAQSMIQAQNSVMFHMGGLVGTALFTVLGGYIAGRLSRPHSLENAAAVGVLSLLLVFVLAVAMPGTSPAWKVIAGALAAVPAALAGGWFAGAGVRSRGRTSAST